MAESSGVLRSPPRSGRLPRATAATALVAALVALLAIPAGAGAGAATATAAVHGPVPLLPAGGVPGEFNQVVATVPVTVKGKVIAGTSNGVAGRLVVAASSVPGATDVLITVPTLSKVPAAAIKVPARQQSLRPIYGLGVLFQRGSHRVVNRKLVVLSFRSKRFTPADYVVVYYAGHHAFVPAAKNHARCTAGECLVKFTAGTEVVVLGP